MEISELNALVGRQKTISLESWAQALLLGNARVASNRNRSSEADRGDGNADVDLLGTLGELLLLHFVKHLPNNEMALQYMKEHLFDPDGGSGVSGPDLSFVEGRVAYGIDVKTFDCKSYKHFFAINSAKHQRLGSTCSFYMGLIAPAYARKGIVA